MQHRLRFLTFSGILALSISTICAEPLSFADIHIDSIVVRAWDIDYNLKDLNYSYSKRDSIRVKIDTNIFAEIMKNVRELYEIGDGKVVPPPRIVCGNGLPYCGIIRACGSDKFTLELYLTCPESDFAGEIRYDSKKYVVTVNNRIQNKLKEVIKRARLKIFKKGRLWESSFDVLKIPQKNRN